MKTYWGGSAAPCILDLSTRCRRVVSFTFRPLYRQGKSPRYPLDRRLGGPQSRSGRGAEEKNSEPPPGMEHPTVASRYTDWAAAALPGRGRHFFLSRPALGPTQPPIQWVKVKLSLCFNWEPRHEGMLGKQRYSSTNSLHSALGGGEWSASRPGRFTPRKRSPVPIG
jgi:hypothetical protein